MLTAKSRLLIPSQTTHKPLKSSKDLSKSNSKQGFLKTPRNQSELDFERETVANLDY